MIVGLAFLIGFFFGATCVLGFAALIGIAETREENDVSLH